MSAYEWTSDMREISGFGSDGDPAGVSYEAGCRAMVSAGARFWDEQTASFSPRFHGYQNIDGIIVEDNDDAKALVRAMLAAAFTDPRTGQPTTVGAYGATGAMVQWSVHHVTLAHRRGWAGYQEEMRKVPDR